MVVVALCLCSLVLSLQAVLKAALNLKHIQCFLHYVRMSLFLHPNSLSIVERERETSASPGWMEGDIKYRKGEKGE